MKNHERRFSIKGAVVGAGAVALTELAVLALSGHIPSEIASYRMDWASSGLLGITPDIMRDALFPTLGGFVGSQLGLRNQNRR